MINKTKLPEIRVAVLDDHPLIRKALQYGLVAEEGIVVVGVFKNCEEAQSALEAGNIDLLVLDYLLQDADLDGLQLIKHLRLRFPKLKILVSSAMESPAIVQLVIKAGVKGFIGKSKEHEELVEAIRRVGKGKRYLSSDMQLKLDKFQETDKEMISYVEPRKEGEDIEVLIRELSPRELEVVRCFLAGMNIIDIAAKYNRSRKTISGQKQSALRKLGLRSDMELFRFNELIPDFL